MESRIKSSICAEIYRQFPEVKGNSPEVKSMPGDKYQLVFHGKVKTEDGKSINRTVRVVTDDSGRIIKLSSSR
ncbi:MAG: hypothetical protein AAGU17_02945 [Anaerolineaceae bacterium]|jgi:hypothetical protein